MHTRCLSYPQSVRKLENFNHILRIQKHFLPVQCLVTPKRVFFREGDLFLVPFKRGAKPSLQARTHTKRTVNVAWF